MIKVILIEDYIKHIQVQTREQKLLIIIITYNSMLLLTYWSVSFFLASTCLFVYEVKILIYFKNGLIRS